MFVHSFDLLALSCLLAPTVTCTRRAPGISIAFLILARPLRRHILALETELAFQNMTVSENSTHDGLTRLLLRWLALTLFGLCNLATYTCAVGSSGGAK